MIRKIKKHDEEREGRSQEELINTMYSNWHYVTHHNSSLCSFLYSCTRSLACALEKCFLLFLFMLHIFFLLRNQPPLHIFLYNFKKLIFFYRFICAEKMNSMQWNSICGKNTCLCVFVTTAVRHEWIKSSLIKSAER